MGRAYVWVTSSSARRRGQSHREASRGTASVAMARAAALPVSVGADCPYVNVTGAGDSAFNGLYELQAQLSSNMPRWVGPGGTVYLQYHAKEEAEGWFGAGTGAVYSLLDTSHKYLARGAILTSPPLEGWTLKSRKVKDPPPVLRCAALPPSCARARITGNALGFASGSILTRQAAATRVAVADGGATSWHRYAMTLPGAGGSVSVEWSDMSSAQRMFSASTPMWGVVAPEAATGQPKHTFVAPDEAMPRSSGPPLSTWRARSTKHHSTSRKDGPPSMSLDCACGAANFEANVKAADDVRRCTQRCTEDPASPACDTCLCQACGLCPPMPPPPPAPPSPPPPPGVSPPPSPPPRPQQQIMLATGFEDGNGAIEVTDSGGGGNGRMAWEMPSRAAKRQGSYGLRVEVTHPFEPAWKAKVALGSFWAVGGFDQLQISFWARAESPDKVPSPHIDVTDIDDKYAWLGYAPPSHGGRPSPSLSPLASHPNRHSSCWQVRHAVRALVHRVASVRCSCTA